MVAVTRFPHDAAERYSKESDYNVWKDKLRILYKKERGRGREREGGEEGERGEGGVFILFDLFYIFMELI